jgi:hypothetical protein
MWRRLLEEDLVLVAAFEAVLVDLESFFAESETASVIVDMALGCGTNLGAAFITLNVLLMEAAQRYQAAIPTHQKLV